MRKLIVILIAVLFVSMLSGLTSYAQEKTGRVFVEAPKNPKTPEEVALAFYFLVKEGKYSEAEKLMAQDSLVEFEYGKSEVKGFMKVVQGIEVKDKRVLDYDYWYVSLHFIESGLNKNYNIDEETLNAIKKGEPVNLGDQENQRVRLLSINEEHKKDTEIYVYLFFHGADSQEYLRYVGYKEEAIPIKLVRQNGEWKMTWLFGVSFIRVPKNPKDPEEIVAAFFFLIKEGRYSEAKKLLAPGSLKRSKYRNMSRINDVMQSIRSIKADSRAILKNDYWDVTLCFIKTKHTSNDRVNEETLNAIKKGEPIQLEGHIEIEYVKLLSVDNEYLAGERATVHCTFYDRGSWSNDEYTELVKLKGEWKVVP